LAQPRVPSNTERPPLGIRSEGVRLGDRAESSSGRAPTVNRNRRDTQGRREEEQRNHGGTIEVVIVLVVLAAAVFVVALLVLLGFLGGR
jgi:hypothetical protein